MIPHRLWQAYTQKGSSVDRPEAGRLAWVWQAVLCICFAQQMHNK
ncbi:MULTISPECIES: hypothetical protein [unclassified Microcoleus]